MNNANGGISERALMENRLDVYLCAQIYLNVCEGLIHIDCCCIKWLVLSGHA